MPTLQVRLLLLLARKSVCPGRCLCSGSLSRALGVSGALLQKYLLRGSSPLSCASSCQIGSSRGFAREATLTLGSLSNRVLTLHSRFRSSASSARSSFGSSIGSSTSLVINYTLTSVASV